ncbi:MAG: helix-turn-helix domain-containing protein, partial [Thermomicrobia bacterium]|nr:helix-turn-helix domain-containing protein [Thermomicrobia bacterium]
MEQGATISEAARILGITENAVLQRIKRGTISATRDANRKWRVFATATDKRPTNQPNDRPTDQSESQPRVPLRLQQEGAALVLREALA